VSNEPVRIVGSVLVHNEDVFVERAIRNVADVCDRIYAFDHRSADRTWDILSTLAGELDQLEVRRITRASESHRPLERYAGTPTWVLGVDGDELFDPSALARLRNELLAGGHADVFRLKGHVLNCEALDEQSSTAEGYMAPPSRPVTKLFNLAAVDSWPGASERLHDGRPEFRSGYGWESLRYLYDRGWDDDPLRCLHVCFLRRSSLDDTARPRVNLNESGNYDRSARGAVKRLLRTRRSPAVDWKRSWYARGERMTVDAASFLQEVA